MQRFGVMIHVTYKIDRNKSVLNDYKLYKIKNNVRINGIPTDRLSN